ncbi:hypothetical protein [Kineosporia sp. NBRC 101731]|uniref:hypothetical protein n=1 Tax=Kineosporia sp. NBRC 101731 TaxID=3032199 RepID=UPI0024A23288|nr:hypothetical protein [Kineosporia sp. NBRC 101731]GLY30709.1 hypothetical protein Kisp02_40740 [Kineosporia sp. NBRC 101731]
MSTPLIVMTALLPLVATLFLGFVVFVFVRVFTSGSATPLATHPDDPGVPVHLYARLTRPGTPRGPRARFDSTLSGRLTLAGEAMYWDPDEGPRWATPLTSITVHTLTGAMSFAGDPGLQIEIAGSGHWLLTVSDKPINRIMGNDAKRYREARRARELAALLVRRGARGATA